MLLNRDAQWPFVLFCDLEVCLAEENHGAFLLTLVHISSSGAEVQEPSGGCLSACRAGLTGNG